MRAMCTKFNFLVVRKEEPVMKRYEEILFNTLKELLKTKKMVTRAEWSMAMGNKRHEGFRMHIKNVIKIYGDSIVEWKSGNKYYYKLKK